MRRERKRACVPAEAECTAAAAELPPAAELARSFGSQPVLHPSLQPSLPHHDAVTEFTKLQNGKKRSLVGKNSIIKNNFETACL